jgi:hypothetical protein
MRPLYWIGTILAAFAGCVAGVFLILPLGLVVAEFVILPLALGFGGLVAALCASWAADLLAVDRLRTRLTLVVAVGEIVAAVFAFVVLLSAIGRNALFGPVFSLGVVACLILALATAAATFAFREPPGGSLGRGRLTILFMALALLIIVVVLTLASLAGLTGA